MSKQYGQFVERASDLIGAYGNFQTAPANVDAETIAAGRCELIRQVMDLFIRWAFQRNPAGFLVNLQGNSIIPPGAYVPWATRGKQRGAAGRPQLTSSERSVVRAWLTILCRDRNGRQPPFRYDASSRRWYVDTIRHPDEATALAWLGRYALTPADYVQIERSLPTVVTGGAKSNDGGSRGEPKPMQGGAKQRDRGSRK